MIVFDIWLDQKSASCNAIYFDGQTKQVVGIVCILLGTLVMALFAPHAALV
jgi:hypothetical protein